LLSFDIRYNRRKSFEMSMGRNMKSISFFVNPKRRYLVVVFSEKRNYIVKPITQKFKTRQYCTLLPKEREGGNL